MSYKTDRFIKSSKEIKERSREIGERIGQELVEDIKKSYGFSEGDWSRAIKNSCANAALQMAYDMADINSEVPADKV